MALPDSLRPPARREADQRLDGDACPCSDCRESYELPPEEGNPDVND